MKFGDHSLYATNVDTGTTRKIATLPPHGGLSTFNADETLAAGAAIVGKIPESLRFAPGHRRLPKGEMMERTLAAHLLRILYTINLKTGARRVILHSTAWLNHLQFSPTDPTLLLYCHEGPWHKVDRIWIIRTDGTHNTLVHKRTMEMEIAGHEFWSLF